MSVVDVTLAWRMLSRLGFRLAIHSSIISRLVGTERHCSHRHKFTLACSIRHTWPVVEGGQKGADGVPEDALSSKVHVVSVRSGANFGSRSHGTRAILNLLLQ